MRSEMPSFPSKDSVMCAPGQLGHYAFTSSTPTEVDANYRIYRNCPTGRVFIWIHLPAVLNPNGGLINGGIRIDGVDQGTIWYLDGGGGAFWHPASGMRRYTVGVGWHTFTLYAYIWPSGTGYIASDYNWTPTATIIDA